MLLNFFYFLRWKGRLVLYFLNLSYRKTKGCKIVHHSIYKSLEVGICQLSLCDMSDIVSHLADEYHRPLYGQLGLKCCQRCLSTGWQKTNRCSPTLPCYHCGLLSDTGRFFVTCFRFIVIEITTILWRVSPLSNRRCLIEEIPFLFLESGAVLLEPNQMLCSRF